MTAIQKILRTIQTGLRDETFKIIIRQDNLDYFAHRAIEAILQKDFLLACKLLVILVARNEPTTQLTFKLPEGTK